VFFEPLISLFIGAVTYGLALAVLGLNRQWVCVSIAVIVAVLLFVRFKTDCPTGIPTAAASTMQCLPEPYLSGDETRLKRYWIRFNRPGTVAVPVEIHSCPATSARTPSAVIWVVKSIRACLLSGFFARLASALAASLS
jgi:hypothetical protein